MRVACRLTVVLAVLCLAVIPSLAPASAQCVGPDNLDVGTCCQPAAATLPPFPGISLPGLGICWTQCTVSATRTLKVAWVTPVQPICSEFQTQITIADGTSGATMLVGPMTLNYTRTWNEVTTAGTTQQVWRFTAKADLSCPATGAPPCPVPSCIQPLGPHATAFFYGYVDYTSCAAAGPWDSVLVLYHAADRFIHMPNLSDKPGAFHPTGSYAIVAPNSALQPFVPMNAIASSGAVVAEATRDVRNPGVPTGSCTVEDHVAFGTFNAQGAGCVNTLSPLPKQQTLRQFTGQNICANTAGVPGGWASLNINFPVLPWFHLVSTSIGAWSNPNVYPGKEFAWADEGLFIHSDPCLGDFVEFKYGATTKDGWLAILPSSAVVTKFTDLADNYTAPLAGPYPAPMIGSMRPTDHLIYVNIP